ncbi:histidine phosphatase family protein [Planococcus sp. 1R117A]|uniref:histidine phosphatase family protein n=1 Tax=Planococcus sp. 1R117A TaxID=3447020 RepID=UPI003EDC21B4
MKKVIFLVRHCKADGQDPSAELTPEGNVQAQELARFFESQEINRIISSPYTRAIQSIDPTAEKLGIRLEIDDRLAERVLSSGEMPDWMERLRESSRDLDLKFSGGESGLEATERGMEVLRDASDGTVLVTHGNLMGLILKRIDESYGYEEWVKLSNPDVYKLEIEERTHQVMRVWE